MSGETTVVKAKFSEAADEVKLFPSEVSAPGAKSFDKYLEEKVLRIKKYAAGGALVSGELAIQEKTAETFTLPAATANFVVAVYSTVAETKVTTSGGAKIFGDFLGILGEGTIILLTNQHILLYADGTNWRVVAGEAKREEKYKSKTLTKAEAIAGTELSKTRPILATFGSGETPYELEIGGISVGAYSGNTTFEINPGQVLKGNKELNIQFLVK